VFFDSPIYFVFLILVALLYWQLPWRKQNGMLLLASYFFYGWWDWRFVGLMILSTTLDYFLAFRIADANDPQRRKFFLILSLTLNFTFLGIFKYFDFFIGSFVHAASMAGWNDLPTPMLRIILPPGISFYTFQEVAYIVDIYKGKQEPARNFVDYALFVSLFPHLIAGPIQRPSHLLAQVQHPRQFDTARFYDGVMLIVFGLFRKCVLADNFGIVANAAFSGRLGNSFLATLTGACAFGFQVYGDFSGYTDLARGSAQLMGFQFAINFRRPYLAVTLQDFWRRWHISLSTWLRDYLYIPLGGSRKGRARTYINLMITMLLGGLWHGANWTFVVWGGIHGFWLATERFFGEELHAPIPKKLGTAISRCITLAVVFLAWVFFRASSLHQAVTMLGNMANLRPDGHLFAPMLYVAALGSVSVAMDLMMEPNDEQYLFQRAPALAPAMATACIAAIVLFGATDSSAFIYFQF
jgi:alginate O-acetyltransferase complex protein AlgI